MRKLFCYALCLLILLLCSCGKSNNNENNGYNSENSTVSSSEVSHIQGTVESNSNVTGDNSSNIVSSITSSKNEENIYNVNDPNNLRGLDTKKYSYSFGVAKNGKAHSISEGNQKKFDKMSNVEALALDTASTDKRMYLTFDCGYEYKNLTGKILDVLNEKNIKAAFFVTLSYAKKNPQFIRRMIDEGHIVGNHSSTHPIFPDISRTKMAEEIYSVEQYLQDNFNYKSKYFRFPTGAYSENSLELVTSIGYKSVFWSLAYGDYDVEKQIGYKEAYKTVIERFHNGAVILLHAISEDNANILGDVIDKAHSEGYNFKTLDDYYK